LLGAGGGGEQQQRDREQPGSVRADPNKKEANGSPPLGAA